MGYYQSMPLGQSSYYTQDQAIERQQQATPQQIAAYNQTISQHGSRLQSLTRQIMSSPYVPTREQVIQLVTTVMTLALMMLLGPVAGTQAGMVSAIVKQIVPLIVATSVHYAADSALPMKLSLPEEAAALARQPIQPVQAPQMSSTMRTF